MKVEILKGTIPTTLRLKIGGKWMGQFNNVEEVLYVIRKAVACLS